DIEGDERLNQAMLDVAVLARDLAVVVGGYGDGRDALKLHHRLDALQQRLIGWRRELAEVES
ncbi:MAG: hypothetical protein QOI71_286, partial [Gaiellales bacterium]|nr:hypothetical protein [Gaiellales bacterium]